MTGDWRGRAGTRRGGRRRSTTTSCARREGARAAARRSSGFRARRMGAGRRPRGRAVAPGAPSKRWWLDDYALFRALHAPSRRAAVDRVARRAAPRASRRRWPPPGVELAAEILYRSSCSGSPTRSGTRRGRRRSPSRCSATCRSWWTATAPTSGRRPDEFRLDASVGAPPDAFSETGQNWGLPVYRWDVMRERGFDVAARSARGDRRTLFDGYRVDHLVGFYRTYVFPRDGSAAVLHAAPTRPTQLALGRNRARRLRASRRPDHRRGSRHGARLRPRLARAAGRARLQGAPLGARVGRARRSRSATRPRTRPRRSRRPARTTPRRSRRGGTASTRTSGRRSSRRRAFGERLDETTRWRPAEALHPGPARRCCSRCSSPPDPTSSCCRSRTCSAGATASTCRRASATTTGPGACRGRSTRWRNSRRRGTGGAACGVEPALEAVGRRRGLQGWRRRLETVKRRNDPGGLRAGRAP